MGRVPQVRGFGPNGGGLWRGRARKTLRFRLRRLIEEALVDCYTEDEQHGAFLVMLQDRVARPFRALVVGKEAEVRDFDWDGTARETQDRVKRRGELVRSVEG